MAVSTKSGEKEKVISCEEKNILTESDNRMEKWLLRQLRQ